MRCMSIPEALSSKRPLQAGCSCGTRHRLSRNQAFRFSQEVVGQETGQLSNKRQLTGKYIIIHQGALGDFLLALPAIEGLHRLYPETLFDFLTRTENVGIIKGRPYLGRVIPQHSTVLTPLYQDNLWQVTEIPPLLADADATFIFGQDSSRVLAERLSVLGLESVHWIRSFPSSRTRQPVTSFIVDQFHHLGWPIENRLVSITPTQRERSAARELLGQMGLNLRPVLIHPGSGGRLKVWPLQNWSSLIHWIAEEHDLPMVMTLGPADGFLSEFADYVKGLGIPVLTNLSLELMAALLFESAFYIGNDSGISHLAAGVGLPGLIFFGPTDPAVWAPSGPGIHILQDRWAEGENLVWSTAKPRQPLPLRILQALQEVIDFSRQSDRFAFC